MLIVLEVLLSIQAVEKRNANLYKKVKVKVKKKMRMICLICVLRTLTLVVTLAVRKTSNCLDKHVNFVTNRFACHIIKLNCMGVVKKLRLQLEKKVYNRFHNQKQLKDRVYKKGLKKILKI